MTFARLILLLIAALPAAAELTPSQHDRVRALEDSLLAPCCYAEPLSRHQSEVALKMKVEIARSVAQGKTDEEIVAAYRAQYGDKVYQPPRPARVWIQLVPWLGLAAGAGLLSLWLFRVARGGHRTPQTHGS